MNDGNLHAGIPLPPFDPVGLPAPAALILGLAYLTFTLHLVAVNFTLGSVLLMVWARLRPDPAREDMARFLGTVAPLGFSYLVTFGIPPLLFVQLLYGQFFYSSSVLVGAFWISVIPLLILAYGALYAHRLTRDGRPGIQGPILWAALLGMLAIGFLYVNNLTLAMTPGRWIEMYAAHPSGGTLNLGEPTILPRLLTFLGLSPAMAGVVLWARGRRLQGATGREAVATATQSAGRKAVGIGVGVWVAGVAAWVATLPDGPRTLLLGGGTWTVAAAAAAVLVLAALLPALLASRGPTPAPAVLSGTALVLGLASLILVRDRVRMEYLRDFVALPEIPVHPQWGMLVLFAVTLVLGVAFTVFWLVRVVRRVPDGAAPSSR
ncbi:hypothetical protein KBD49_01185 [Myxococcota bacterium]|jgi:hypothetical protein|nr:hypothetical protein [Myxococcota bacterium]